VSCEPITRSTAPSSFRDFDRQQLKRLPWRTPLPAGALQRSGRMSVSYVPRPARHGTAVAS
jgi:hypothetical protein